MNIKHNYFPNLLLNTKRFVFMSGEAPSAPEQDMSMPEQTQSDAVEKPKVKLDFSETSKDDLPEQADLNAQLPEDYLEGILTKVEDDANASLTAIDSYLKNPDADTSWAEEMKANIRAALNETRAELSRRWNAYKADLLKQQENARALTVEKLLFEASDKTLERASTNSSLSELEKVDPIWYGENGAKLEAKVDDLLKMQKIAEDNEEAADAMKNIRKDIDDGAKYFPDIVGDEYPGLGKSFDEQETIGIARGLAAAIYDSKGSLNDYADYLKRCKTSVTKRTGDIYKDGNISLKSFIDAAVPVEQSAEMLAKHNELLKDLASSVKAWNSPSAGYAYGSMLEAEKVFAKDPSALKMYEKYVKKTLDQSTKDGVLLRGILVSPSQFKKECLAKAINELRPTNPNENMAKNAEFLIGLKDNIKASQDLWENGLKALGLSVNQLAAVKQAELEHITVLSTLPALGSLDLPNSESGKALSVTVADLPSKVLSQLRNKAETLQSESLAKLGDSPASKKAAAFDEKIKSSGLNLNNIEETIKTNTIESLANSVKAFESLKSYKLPVGQSFDVADLETLPALISKAKTALDDAEVAIDNFDKYIEASKTKVNQPIKPKRKKTPTQEPKEKTPKAEEAPVEAKAPAVEATKTPEAPVKEARFIDSKEDVRSAKRDADGNVSRAEQLSAVAKEAAPVKERSVADVDKMLGKNAKNSAPARRTEVASN